MSSLADRIITSLSALKDYKQYQENLDRYELLNRIIRQVKEDSKKILLFEKNLDFADGSYYAQRYFSRRLQTYTSWQPLKSIILERGYLDRIIELFTKSNSFEIAGNTSGISPNFVNDFTEEHARNIVEASIKNDQNYYSYAAKRNLRGLFLAHKELISAEEKAKIKELMHIDIPD